MSEAPDVDVETSGTAATAASPLDAAAAQGGLHWPSDPELDPEGSPEPLQVPHANIPGTLSSFDGRG